MRAIKGVWTRVCRYKEHRFPNGVSPSNCLIIYKSADIYVAEKKWPVHRAINHLKLFRGFFWGFQWIWSKSQVHIAFPCFVLTSMYGNVSGRLQGKPLTSLCLLNLCSYDSLSVGIWFGVNIFIRSAYRSNHVNHHQISKWAYCKHRRPASRLHQGPIFVQGDDCRTRGRAHRACPEMNVTLRNWLCSINNVLSSIEYNPWLRKDMKTRNI